MKNIIRMAGILAATSFLTLSCDLHEFDVVGEPLASEVSVSVDTVALAAENGSGKLTVTANGDWVAATNGCSWVKISPMSGSGSTVVTISAADNVDEWKEVQGPRSAAISFAGAEKLCKVVLNQAGEKGLDTKTIYKPIAKIEDFDASKSFLLVAKYNNEPYIPMNLSGATASTWQYMYAEKVTVADGAIEMPTDGKSYKAVAKDATTYALQQPDGTFISHVSGRSGAFYAMADAASAEAHTLSFDSDGHAIFTNAEGCFSRTDYKGTVEYTGTIAAESVASPDCLPVMYISAKVPTGEVLMADDVVASALADSATITIKSNRSWKVRNHSDWVSSFTREGTGNGTIKVKFSKNDQSDASRTAEFTVIGETTNVTVNLTQSGVVTVSKITEAGNYCVKNAVVMANGNSNVILNDGTGNILMYARGNSLKIGDVLTVSGPVIVYCGVFEFSNATFEVTGNTTPQYPSAVTFDAAAIETYLTATPVEIKYVQVTGSQSNWDLTVTGTSTKINLNGPSKYTGSVDAKGYVVGVKSSKVTMVVSEYNKL